MKIGMGNDGTYFTANRWGERHFYVHGKEVTERAWETIMNREEKAWDKERKARRSLPKAHNFNFIDRDGRMAMANNGKGTECPTLSKDPTNPVYVDSRGDMERLAESMGQEVVSVESGYDRWQDTARTFKKEKHRDDIIPDDFV